MCEARQYGRVDDVEFALEVSGHGALRKSFAAHASSELVAVPVFIAVAALTRNELTLDYLVLAALTAVDHISPEPYGCSAHLIEALVNRCDRRVENLTVVDIIEACNQDILRHFVSVVAQRDACLHRKSVVSTDKDIREFLT